MRRDVRLLGGLLGDVLRESGGQDLLDDTERLRLAVIAARRPGAGDRAVSEVTDLVASWPLERAEAAAGTLLVTSDAGGDVYVDGQRRDAAPAIITASAMPMASVWYSYPSVPNGSAPCQFIR